MDLHYKQEVTVGALVLTGLGIFIAGTMWLSGRSMRATDRTVRAQFANVGTLKRGNEVKVSGVTMGVVEDIRFEDVGRVIVDMSLSPRIVPRTDATITLTSVGLVGDVVVTLDPGTAADPLPPDGVIPGTIARGLTDIGSDMADEAQKTLEGVQAVANQRLADDLSATMASTRRLLDSYSGESGPRDELTAMVRSMTRLSERIDSVLGVVDLAGSLRRTDSLVASTRTLTTQFTATGAQLDTLLRRMNAGEGTLGLLARDTAFYRNTERLLKSLQEFADTLKKNPGKITIQVKVF